MRRSTLSWSSSSLTAEPGGLGAEQVGDRGQRGAEAEVALVAAGGREVGELSQALPDDLPRGVAVGSSQSAS